jgi:hypothetical protein
MENKFKVGDLVECIKSISSNEGGPEKGEYFIITSIDDNKDLYIGFPLKRLSNNYSSDIKKGKQSNWGISEFKLIRRSELGKILYDK